MDQTFVRVDTFMRRDMHRIDGLLSIRDALKEMKKHRISSLIIDRRHPGDEYGFLTLKEVAARVIAVNRSLERTSVYEIMEKPVLTIQPDMNVKYAIRLLTQLGRGRALVCDDTGVIGFVSLGDLVLSYADAAAAPDTDKTA